MVGYCGSGVVLQLIDNEKFQLDSRWAICLFADFCSSASGWLDLGNILSNLHIAA